MTSRVEIIPAIIAPDFRSVEHKLNKIDGLTAWAQLDVMDGLFAPETSFNEPALLQELNGKVKIEAHLMIEEPESELPDWLLVTDRVIVHYEATQRLDEILDQINLSTVKAGVALLLPTPVEKIAAYLNKVDLIQLMGIKAIGYHGHPLDERVFEKIRLLRALNPDVKIAIDGGVNLDNAKRLIKAGATQLVIGSALWESKNLAATIKSFQNVAR